MRICSLCKALLPLDARVCPTDNAPGEDVDSLPNGSKLGPYRVEKMLGEGGMGFVYEATHEVLNRRTAIKLLRPELGNNAQVVIRFLQEAKAVNLIDHGNIVNVYDYSDGAETGLVYFVMEYLEGETLDDLMRKRRPMSPALLLHTYMQVCRALAAAHAKKIVHRDLKPANVYVIAREDNPYFIKLLDFGIAQLRGEGEIKGLTVTGSVMGTPLFMSPEQITGAGVDARTDIWALGVMLYRAATGEYPFKGEGFGELAGQILNNTLPPPSKAAPNAGILPALDAVIMSCLQRKLPDRCPSVDELIAGLNRVKEAYKLDDKTILAEVKADAGVLSEPLPELRSAPTRGSLIASLPQYQGYVAGNDVPRAAPTAKSKAPMAIGAGLVVAGLAVGGYFISHKKSDATPAPVASVVAAPPTPSKTIKELFTSGDKAGVRTQAEKNLHEAIASGNVQLQGQAVDALDRGLSPAAAPLLYLALKGTPELRVKAARSLGELGLPDSAPKVRAALDDSGDKVRVELAAVLSGLGDKDSLAILKRAVGDPGMRLTAAVALASIVPPGGDDPAARQVFTDILDATPQGREQWRRAAAGLWKLGDAKGHDALATELTQPDAARAVAAAEIMAKRGDTAAHDYLTRVAADKEFARRGEAAFALARIGDAGALGWVPDGLHSTDAEERKLAIGICARLAQRGGDKSAADIAALATDDSDHGVQLAAAAALLVL